MIRRAYKILRERQQQEDIIAHKEEKRESSGDNHEIGVIGKE